MSTVNQGSFTRPPQFGEQITGHTLRTKRRVVAEQVLNPALPLKSDVYQSSTEQEFTEDTRTAIRTFQHQLDTAEGNIAWQPSFHLVKGINPEEIDGTEKNGLNFTLKNTVFQDANKDYKTTEDGFYVVQQNLYAVRNIPDENTDPPSV